jgi:uncharacterized protein (DUF488 family)
VWTIGHSTLPAPDFLRPLQAHGVDLLADVRRTPGSRRSPQFGRDQLPSWLGEAGIDYVHLSELGGRRRQQDVDPTRNAGWQNRSFKNYADYTLTPEYERGLEQLTRLATTRRVAIMCAESLPWRCHRLLISNTLAARGWRVWHLIDDSPPVAHQLGQWGAQPSIDPAGQLTYPAG